MQCKTLLYILLLLFVHVSKEICKEILQRKSNFLKFCYRHPFVMFTFGFYMMCVTSTWWYEADGEGVPVIDKDGRVLCEALQKCTRIQKAHRGKTVKSG